MAKQVLNDVLITGEQTYRSIDDTIDKLVFNQKLHKIAWWIFFVTGLSLFGLFQVTVGWLLYQGVGIWGNNIPTAWAFDIINFVWWIGIGHAGTLISAILLLLRQNWRNSINRFAEAMTIFAVFCAVQFPLLHTGRPWVAAYWLFPYPNIMGMWPNFRSPLMWDVFAVNTYLSVSAIFWFIGLIPDFATLRDKATNKVPKVIYGILSLGWRGSNQHWHRYEQAYLLLAGLSTPLVLSVHTIVSFDFASSIVPGWNVTVFPPYFVAGAVFAGFAMVILFAIPLRKWYDGFSDLITVRHLDWMAKILLATGLIVFYGYILEVFYAWYSGNAFEMALLKLRMNSPYAWAYFMLILCNGIIPQLFWIPAARRNNACLVFVALAVSVGMWLERFVIIPMSLMSNYLPSSNQPYYPTVWDFAMFLGTIGLFLTLMFLFFRALPVINMFEMKGLLHQLAKSGQVPNPTPAREPAKPAAETITAGGDL
ncbi:MAG: NrfD/PsrC family molybdoenzyme membrane anchor subunit [Fimbriimonas sp.]